MTPTAIAEAARTAPALAVFAPPGEDGWFASSGHRVGYGVFDGLTARLASDAGPDFLWLSSFCVSAVRGHPDNGILDAGDMAEAVRMVTTHSTLPLLVDMDSGYGGPEKVAATVRQMARSGAAAVCIEDNPLAKHCSLYDVGRRHLAKIDEHAGRIRAARAGAAGSACQVVARTEALVGGFGIAEAMTRAAAYVEAGADGVFVQATAADGGAELLAFAQAWDRCTPLFIAPTCYPSLTRQQLADAGVSHNIFANHALRAAVRAMTAAYAAMAGAACAADLEADLATVSEVAGVLGQHGVAAGLGSASLGQAIR